MKISARLAAATSLIIVILMFSADAAFACTTWTVVSGANIKRDDNELFALSALSKRQVWAVGEHGANGGWGRTLAEHWNGSGWTLYATPNIVATNTNDVLYGVASLSSSDAWAVGAATGLSNGGIILRWNGASWQLVPDPAATNDALLGISSCSAADIWAVGYTPGNYASNYEPQSVIEHFDGSSWTVVPSPAAPSVGYVLDAVTCLSSTDAWAVGYSDAQTLAEHWDGTSWTVVSSPEPAPGSKLNAISASSSSDIWAVGTSVGSYHSTLTEHWDGTSWAVVTSPNPSTDNYLTGVIAISPTNALAVGYRYGTYTPGPSLMERWNGTSWSVVKAPQPYQSGVKPKYQNGMLEAISRVPGQTTLWTVGSYWNWGVSRDRTLTAKDC
jgi:hypothetical protein